MARPEHLERTPVVKRALLALSDALLRISQQRDSDQLLEQLVETARQLVNARYGALGIPTPEHTRACTNALRRPAAATMTATPSDTAGRKNPATESARCTSEL